MKSKFSFMLCIVLGLMNSGIAQHHMGHQMDDHMGHRMDTHAPISVMGDHTHMKNGFMLSYRFMSMNMDGLFSGSKTISQSDVLNAFMVTPKDMTMDMHMLSAMYAPSNDLTLMLMTSFISNSMRLKTRMNVHFSTESSGLSDLKIMGVYKLHASGNNHVLVNLGFSIPTGDLNQKDDTPMANNTKLAYPMQLGSGTIDPSLGFTYSGQSTSLSWGAQAKYTTRLDENDEGYTLGDRLDIQIWGAYLLSKNLSINSRIAYLDLGSIEGADPELNPMMMPLFDSNNSGRSQTSLGFGLNYYLKHGFLKNTRLGFEYMIPVSQDVEGIQMETTSVIIFGIQYSIM